MEEAMNALALLASGIYGSTLPNSSAHRCASRAMEIRL